MTDVNKLKEDELRQLQNDDVIDLETLITDGADARFPVRIKFPKKQEDGSVEMVTGGALLRPLTNVEWNNCTRLQRNANDNTTNEVELLKKAMYTTSGDQFPAQLVEQLPNGVVLELVEKLSEISGVDMEKNRKMVRDMVGFSI